MSSDSTLSHAWEWEGSTVSGSVALHHHLWACACQPDAFEWRDCAVHSMYNHFTCMQVLGRSPLVVQLRSATACVSACSDHLAPHSRPASRVAAPPVPLFPYISATLFPLGWTCDGPAPHSGWEKLQLVLKTRGLVFSASSSQAPLHLRARAPTHQSVSRMRVCVCATCMHGAGQAGRRTAWTRASSPLGHWPLLLQCFAAHQPAPTDTARARMGGST